MIKEKSCGAVIFKNFNGKNKYLVLEMQKGHFSLCKGHQEGLETDIETATREIKEETNLDVRFFDNFKEKITYSPYEGCIKDVYFFLAEALDSNFTIQLSEVKHAYWFTYDEALERLTYEADKNVLVKAQDYLKVLQ